MDKQPLTEEEIDAIARKVSEQLTQDIYRNVGMGVMGLAWKGIIILIVALAAYGASIHFFK